MKKIYQNLTQTKINNKNMYLKINLLASID